MVDLSVRIHAMDEHCVVETLNAMPEIIMPIVVARLVSLVTRKLVAGKSSAKVIETARMTSYAIRICAKLLV